MHHILQYTAPLDTIIKAALRATMYLMRDPAPHPPFRSDMILFNSPEPGILESIRRMLAGGDRPGA